MANVNYTKDEVNNGIEGGLRYLRDFNMLDEYGKDTEYEGTIKGLMNDIEEAVNHYVSVTPKEKVINGSFNEQTEPGFWKVSITSNSTDGPYSITNTSSGFFWVINYSELTIIQLLIPTQNANHYGKWLYRRGYRDNINTSYNWSKWRYPIMDTENKVGELQEIWSGISSQTGFRLKGHNANGAYDYDLALKSDSNQYGLQDNNNKWILYKNKNSNNFIYDGELKNIVPINKGGSGLATSPNMRINLGSEESVDIMAASPKPGIEGKLPLNHGGTNSNLSNMPPYAIVRRVSKTKDEFLQDGEQIPTTYDVPNDKYLYYTTTKKGALYALGENGEPKFGTLPIDCGGTGITASPSLLVNLNSTTATNLFSESPRPGVTGILPVKNGGTGSGQIYKSVNIIYETNFTQEINQHGPDSTSNYTSPIGKPYSEILTWDPDKKFYNLGAKVGTESQYVTGAYLTFTQQAGGLVLLRLTIDNLTPKETIAANTILNLLEWNDEFDFDPYYSMALSFYSNQNVDAQAKIVAHTWKVDENKEPICGTTAATGKIGLRLLTEMKAGQPYDIYVSGVYRGQYSNY